MASKITIRKPQLRFEEADIIWEENPEVSLEWNAMSYSAPVVEPWLNKVMMRARALIRDDRPDLKDDIDNFVRQESTHYRMHEAFNEYTAKAGYIMPDGLEERQKAEFRQLLKTKSIRFLVAYCAGFENTTLYSSQFLYEEAGDLFKAGDNGIGDLWLWHFAEEYEHRSVCHDVFAHISGNYFIRVYGLLYSLWHLDRCVQERVNALQEIRRKGMSEEERAASVKRQKAYRWRFAKFFLPRILKILVPFYTPGKIQPSPGLLDALDHYEKLTAKPA